MKKKFIYKIIVVIAFFLIAFFYNASPKEDYEKVDNQESQQVENQVEENEDENIEEISEPADELVETSIMEHLVNLGQLIEEKDSQGKSIGWSSAEGLFYGMGSQEGNRVLHVLEHIKPNPDKKIHSVFLADENTLILLLDEAWVKGREGDFQLQENGNRVYDVFMDRVIGTENQKKIRLVIKDGTQDIITAYPKGY